MRSGSRGLPARLLAFLVLALALGLSLSACSRSSSGDDSAVDAATYAAPASEPVAAGELGKVAADQIVVVLDEDASDQAPEEAAKAVDGEVVGRIDAAGIYQIGIQPTDGAGVLAAAKAASAVDGVANAAPHQIAWLRTDMKGTPCSLIGDEPKYAGEGGLAFGNTGVERAWKIVKASGLPLAETKVGVVDESLSGRSDEFIYLGLEQRGEKSRSRLRGHGDDVAGIIAADPDNGGAIGMASVLGNKLKLVHSDLEFGIDKVAKDAASISATQAADPTIGKLSDGGAYAIQPLVTMLQQVRDGATVVNCSWGNDKATPELVATYRRFFETMSKEHPDVLFVCAAPNGGESDVKLNGSNDIPSGLRLPNVMTVGNVALEGRIGSVQAEGDGEISLVAPGGIQGMEVEKAEDGSISSYLGDGGDGCTSYATPQVTSAAAILQSINPDLTGAQVKRILVETASTEMTTRKGTKWPIPASMGGRMLSVDAAVLRVVNDIRKKADANAKDLTMADIEALYGVDLIASSADGKEWDIAASIAGAGAKGTDLAIRLDGQGAIGGSQSQPVASSGAAKWSVTVLGDPIVAHVKRADTGACSRLEVGADPWVGTWEWKDAGIDFLYRLVITRGSGGYVGKMNSALDFHVSFGGDSIKSVAVFSTMFRKDNTVTFSGRMVDGSIVGTRVWDDESGVEKKDWKPTKVK